MADTTNSQTRNEMIEFTLGAGSTTPAGRLVVGHCVNVYLSLTESFIYTYITHHQRAIPIVLARRIANRAFFPFSPVYAALGEGDTGRRIWGDLSYKLRLDVLRRHPLEWVIRREQINILHAHFGYMGARLAPIARKLDLPLVTTFYGFDACASRYLRRFHRAYQRLFSQGSLFLVEGPYLRQQLINLGCPPAKVAVQRTALELSRYRCRSAVDDGPTRTRILLCGRFVEKKGMTYALQALRIVVASHPEVLLVVVGGGPLEARLCHQVNQLGLQRQVRMRGLLSYAAYLEELHQDDFLICPSVTTADGDSEGGAPTVLLKAQACGLPVVATRHADIPYVVQDGQSAFLVPERDVPALADRMTWLLEHPRRRVAMGLAGRRHVAARHDIHREMVRLEAKYERLVTT